MFSHWTEKKGCFFEGKLFVQSLSNYKLKSGLTTKWDDTGIQVGAMNVYRNAGNFNLILHFNKMSIFIKNDLVYLFSVKKYITSFFCTGIEAGLKKWYKKKGLFILSYYSNKNSKLQWHKNSLITINHLFCSFWKFGKKVKVEHL